MLSNFASMRDNPAQYVLDEISDKGTEGACNRWYGLYKGIVLNNDHPSKRGLCVLQVPCMGHDTPDKVPVDWWARPCMPGLSVGGSGQMHGMFMPPELGDEVWVQFENGHPSFPVYTGGYLRVSFEGQELLAEQALYKGIRTSTGHFLRFSDDKEDLHITIAKGDGAGSVSGATISLMKDGSAVIANDKNSSVFLDAKTNNVTMMSSDGEKMLSSVMAGNDKVVAMTASGGSFSLNKDVFQFNGKDFIVNASGKCALLAGKVFLGKGTKYEPAVRGYKLAIWSKKHQHMCAAPQSPSLPDPQPPLLPMNELSEIVSIA